LQDTVPNQETGNRQIVYYLPSTAAGASAGAAAGAVSVAGAGAGVVAVAGLSAAVLGADSGALVAVGSSALLQPANNANVTKPVAIIALVFIVVSYYFKFLIGFSLPEKFQGNYNANT
jgi:hypothetical protein